MTTLIGYACWLAGMYYVGRVTGEAGWPLWKAMLLFTALALGYAL